MPLSQVARVRDTLEEPVLWRRNRDMAITVRADVKDGEQGVSATESIVPQLKDIRAKLPSGYRIDVGGAVEESDKANAALAAVFPVMLVTILAMLMLQLQSFAKMFMVLLTAPLGLIGVVAALLIFQAPLGFVAILGITALSGMIMRNSVILVDQVREEMELGLDPWNAVLEAAVHRTRPVMLTAAATVLAMVPLTRSVFWGPMAIAIMGGLTVATLADDLLRAGAVRGVVQGRAGFCSGSDALGGRRPGMKHRHEFDTRDHEQPMKAARLASSQRRLRVGLVPGHRGWRSSC